MEMMEDAVPAWTDAGADRYPPWMKNLRKRLLTSAEPIPAGSAEPTRAAPTEIDLSRSATLAYSSEHPDHPIEHILGGIDWPRGSRWIAARPDTTEQIVVQLDAPRPIGRIVYEVEEAERDRTQEIRIEASDDGGRTYRGLLVQEYNFSPAGATHQREDLRLDLAAATHLRLTIVPNKRGSGPATLSSLRLFA